MRNLLFIVIVFSAMSPLMAQTDSTATEQEETENTVNYQPIDPRQVSQRKGYESEKLNQKNFDQKKWKQIVGDEDFAEGASKKKKKSAADSIDTNGKKRARDFEEDTEDESSGISLPINSGLLKILVYAVAIGIIGYILYVIIKNTSFKSNQKISKPSPSDAAAPITDIKALEIDELLRDALSKGNYRLAIRIYFLGLLKRLDEEGFIRWKKDKTNHDYLSELFAKAYYFEEIRRLTLAYEQVWYGEHPLSAVAFEQISASFQSIDQKLNATKDL